MYKQFLKTELHPLFAIAEGLDKGILGGGSKEDTFELLKDDDDDVKDDVIPLDDKKEKKEEKLEDDKDDDKDDDKKEDKEEEDDEDELKQLEEELEEPDDEKLELVVPVPRREILKKYPQLFKEFPYLEKAYYREQQFTQLLPTIDDAKEAVAKSETLDRLDKDLMDGSIEKILLAAKENTDGFHKIVDNLMDTLAKVDEKAFFHVVGNTTKQIIAQMVAESRETKNEALESAAVILNQFVFGNSKYTPPTKLHVEKKDDPEKNKIEEREKEINQREFEKARTELNSKVNNSIKSTIDAHIDPKQTMTDYVRRNAIREANEALQDLIGKDSRFKTLVGKLWENAQKNKFDDKSVGLIRTAFLSKAKTLLPAVIKQARNEALKGMGKRADSKENESDETPKGKQKEQTERTQSRSHDKSDKGKVPAGMSTLEYLMSDD